MRIYGNRQLKTVSGQKTRPTSAKVREALFNILQGRVADRSWLDLCAGNGSMGAEALCRGATIVVGIEKYPKACQIIQQNWQKVAGLGQSFQVIQGDVLVKIKSLAGRQFDYIYFDPPYDSYLYLPILKAIASLQLSPSDGAIVVEHDTKLWQAATISGLEIYRQKSYGKTSLTFYRINK
jgi:16S rRNA (guanine966-N2)-methyltransferase